MNIVVQFLIGHPLVTLFLISAIGYGLGQIPIGKSRIRVGVAAVLFVALACGALSPKIQLPDFPTQFGLALFMYTVGIEAAPNFLTLFTRRGIRDILLCTTALIPGMILLWLSPLVNGDKVAPAALFAGFESSTTGLATLLEGLKQTGHAALASRAIVSFSLAYPLSVVIPIALILLAPRFAKVNLKAEARTLPEYAESVTPLETTTLKVTNPAAVGKPVHAFSRPRHHTLVIIGRIVRDGVSILAENQMPLQLNDLVVVVGTHAHIDAVAAQIGPREFANAVHEQTDFEYRRIFVSNPQVVGTPLSRLDLPQVSGMIITRIRRGDTEFIPDGDTCLELGDRIRVLAQKDSFENVRTYFGDSFQAVSEVDFLSLGIGMVVGLFLGTIPIPLPGGVIFRFGNSAGPLMSAIVLGRLQRTGPIAWRLPFPTLRTLRQLGLMMFVAGIGTQAGYLFLRTVESTEGMRFIGIALIAALTNGIFLFMLGRKWGRSFTILNGIYAGALTQAVVSDFACDQSGTDIPSKGYAQLFAPATLMKIILTQLLFLRWR